MDPPGLHLMNYWLYLRVDGFPRECQVGYTDYDAQAGWPQTTCAHTNYLGEVRARLTGHGKQALLSSKCIMPGWSQHPVVGE